MFDDYQEYKIPLLENGVRLPTFTLDKEYLRRNGYNENISNYQFLVEVAKKGLVAKIGENNPRIAEYKTRANEEIKLIKDLGFVDYVLITWDIVRFCRDNGIATGFGRGSASGSLLLYLVDVTKVDSLKYDLYFERFLNKTRAKFAEIDGVRYYDGNSLFDVDLDIDHTKRHLVVEYLISKYPGRVAKLLTLTTLSTKILIKEVVKIALGYSEEDACLVSDMIPKEYGVVADLDKAYAQSQDFKAVCDKNPEVITAAKRLYLLTRNASLHASAFLITYDPIDEVFPLQTTKDGEIVTGYSMEDAMSLSIKVDLLGLRSATLVNNICKNLSIRMEDVDLNDPVIYNAYKDLKTPQGLFQLEASTNYDVLKKVKPRNLEDLSAVLAIARPGALQFADKFAEYVNTGKKESLHPLFDKVLEKTGMACLYQEQTLQLLNKVGFDLTSAESIRRIVGKKLTSEVVKWEAKIKEKVAENNLGDAAFEILWRIINDSASYSFNKSHSLAYAMLSATTTYLKFKHPQQFFLELLKMSKDESNPTEEISKAISELPYFNTRLLPPHILKSEMDFTIEGADIRMGIGNIKGISEKSFEKLKQFKHAHSNKFEIFQAAKEAKIPIGIVSSLIMAGSIDDMLTQSRLLTVMEACLWNLLTDKEKKFAKQYGTEYGFDLCRLVKELNSVKKDEKGKPLIKDSRRQTLLRNFSPYFSLYKENSKNHKFAHWMFEKNLLGYSYTTSLFEIYDPITADLSTILQVTGELDGERVRIVGEVMDVKSGKSREKKTPYLKITCKDHTGTITCLMFNNARNANIDEHIEDNGRKVQEGDIVVVKGSKKGDCIFAEKIGVQDKSIFTKISQLKQKAADADI